MTMMNVSAGNTKTYINKKYKYISSIETLEVFVQTRVLTISEITPQ
jgi:hypothetical protein